MSWSLKQNCLANQKNLTQCYSNKSPREARSLCSAGTALKANDCISLELSLFFIWASLPCDSTLIAPITLISWALLAKLAISYSIKASEYAMKCLWTLRYCFFKPRHSSTIEFDQSACAQNIVARLGPSTCSICYSKWLCSVSNSITSFCPDIT